MFRDGVLVEDGAIQVGDDVHVAVETSEPAAMVRVLSPFLLSQENVLVSGSAMSINASYTYKEEDAPSIGGNRFVFHVKEARDFAGNTAEGVTQATPYVVLLPDKDMVFETVGSYVDREGVEVRERAPLAEPVPIDDTGIWHHLILTPNPLSAPSIQSE